MTTPTDAYYDALDRDARNYPVWPDVGPLRKSKGQRTRERLARRDGSLCCWCRGQLEILGHEGLPASIEHLVPRSRGGGNEAENLALACVPCNSARGNASIEGT